MSRLKFDDEYDYPDEEFSEPPRKRYDKKKQNLRSARREKLKQKESFFQETE